ncbi:MAG: hypothetical protein KDB82_10105 [Planctomycetes bacterium]|nr:hypothetical protein [Planctomycetota bacterium]
MKLRKLDVSYVHDLPGDAGLKGVCLLLPGTLNARAELDELPKDLLAQLPAVVLCSGCNAYLERLLNERGVAVTTTRDPVDSVPDDAEVELDLLAGTLTELSSGRKFALRPLKPNHLQFVRAHG